VLSWTAVLIWAGDSASALATAERAATLAEASDDSGLHARALNALGHIVGQVRDVTEGMVILREAVRRATAAGLVAEIARAELNLSTFAWTAGDIGTMELHARRGLELVGAPAGQSAMLRINLGFARASLGDLDGALAHMLTAFRHAARIGPHNEARVVAALAYVHAWRGEVAAARRLLEEHDAALSGIETLRLTQAWATLLEQEGSPDQALARFQQAVAEDPDAFWQLAYVARTAVAAGELATAQAALARLEEVVEDSPGAVRWRDEARGWVAVGEGRTSDAIEALQAAAGTTTQAFSAAKLRLEAARLSGDRQAVRDLIAAFEQMGAARDADRARAVARQLGMRPGRRRAPAGLLTAREQEVAQLVAAGYTNAEIAAKLYLSPRTIERHIGSILTKLSYRSRIEIAAHVASGKLPDAPTNATRTPPIHRAEHLGSPQPNR